MNFGVAVFALEFPPINAILRWKDLFPTFNKVALIAVAAALIGIIIFLLAGNRDGTKHRAACATSPRSSSSSSRIRS